jgi:hypothetical protein
MGPRIVGAPAGYAQMKPVNSDMNREKANSAVSLPQFQTTVPNSFPYLRSEPPQRAPESYSGCGTQKARREFVAVPDLEARERPARFRVNAAPSSRKINGLRHDSADRPQSALGPETCIKPVHTCPCVGPTLRDHADGRRSAEDRICDCDGRDHAFARTAARSAPGGG